MLAKKNYLTRSRCQRWKGSKGSVALDNHGESLEILLSW